MKARRVLPGRHHRGETLDRKVHVRGEGKSGGESDLASLVFSRDVGARMIGWGG